MIIYIQYIILKIIKFLQITWPLQMLALRLIIMDYTVLIILFLRFTIYILDILLLNYLTVLLLQVILIVLTIELYKIKLF